MGFSLQPGMEMLVDVFAESARQAWRLAGDVAAGCEVARSLAGTADRIVVLGSFHTVGPALEWLGL